MKKLLLFLSLLFSLPAWGTTLTGTVNNPDGTAFSGTIIFTLSASTTISTTTLASGYVCPGPLFVSNLNSVTVQVLNGVMQSTVNLYDSECTQPAGIPYNVEFISRTGSITNQTWVVTGVNENIGTIVPVQNNNVVFNVPLQGTSPGGTNGALQVNDNGVFGGATSAQIATALSATPQPITVSACTGCGSGSGAFAANIPVLASSNTGAGVAATSAGIAGVNSKTIERVFTAGSLTQTYTHNLGVLNPSMTCYVNSGSTSYSITGSTTNSVTLTAAAPSDIVCAFVATIPNPGTFAFTIPTSTSYIPSMSGTQTVNLPVAQTMYSGYTGTETYTTTGAATGITLTEPGPLANTANGNLTLSFPATQAAGTSNLTVSATDGVQSYSNPAAFTISDINQGLVDGWQMNEGTGTTFFDATSGADNQTFVSTYGTWAAHTGYPGSSFSFNGTGGSVGSNQTNTNFATSSPFSACAWIDTTTVSVSDQGIFSTVNFATSTAPGWDMEVANNYVEVSLIADLATNAAIHVESPVGSIAANTLYHTCFTYSGSGTAAGVTIYINGAAQTPYVVRDALAGGSIQNTNYVSIGARQNPAGTATSSPYSGVIGYARIYNRVLSATDVANYYAAGPK